MERPYTKLWGSPETCTERPAWALIRPFDRDRKKKAQGPGMSRSPRCCIHEHRRSEPHRRRPLHPPAGAASSSDYLSFMSPPSARLASQGAGLAVYGAGCRLRPAPMPRAFLTLALTAAFLSLGSEAQAQDCRCASSQLRSSFLPDLYPMASGDVSAFCAPQPNGLAALAHAAAEPLWCEDSDDPRCAPMRESERTPNAPIVPAPASEPSAGLVIAPPRLTQAPFGWPRLQRPRAEHRRRLDRPPRS